LGQCTAREDANPSFTYSDERAARVACQWVEEVQRADLCVECGECLEKCPQHIDIPEWLARAHELLAGEQSG
jgi:predicted aldo/keto reductase-like oxidoreductase